MTPCNEQSARQTPATTPCTPLFRFLCCAALFFIITGARLLIIGKYGSDLPYWDQWDAEWRTLLRPYLADEIRLPDLFAPHNEHRILFTRLMTLCLFQINGQWDPMLEIVTNSLLYPLVAVFLFLAFSKDRSSLCLLLWTAVLTAVFSLPYAWENTLAGFQSQFYFMTGFSLLTLHLFSHVRPAAGKLLAGSVCGAAALFTMGSGFFAPLAVMAVLLLAACRNRGDLAGMLRESRWAALACVMLIAAGIFLSVHFSGHDQYRAHSLKEFATAATALLSWPRSAWKGWFILSWLPFALFTVAYVTRRQPEGRQERFLLGMGVWVVLQSAATAFSRAAIVQNPRYTDLLSIGLLVNFLCAVMLLEQCGSRRQLRIGAAFLFGCWLWVNGAGLYRVSFNGLLTSKGITSAMETRAVAGYVRTSVASFLIPDGFKNKIPYPDSDRLKAFLDDPLIRAILPAGVRGAAPLQAVQGDPQITARAEGFLPSPPYSWERLWLVTGRPAGFIVAGNGRLPYLQLLATGDSGRIRSMDSSGRQRQAIRLDGLAGSGWQRLLIPCPGETCRITVDPGEKQVILSSPYETGRVSSYALLLTDRARYLLLIGIGTVIMAISLLVIRHIGQRPTGIVSQS